MYLFFISTYLWTNLVLVFFLFLKKLNYDGQKGNLEIWILGMIINFIYILYLKEDFMKLLMTSTQKLSRPELALRKIYYFLKMIDKKNSTKKYGIFLKGFIFQHEETCDIEGCSLKKYKEKMIKGPKLSKSDQDFLLMTYCMKMFEIALFK